MHPLGQSRTVVRRNHVFIAPDSYVWEPPPGWSETEAVTLISPEMGSRFTQLLIAMQAGGRAGAPLRGVERFLFVLEGRISFRTEAGGVTLGTGEFAFVPPELEHEVVAEESVRLVLFEKPYEPREGVGRPAAVTGASAAVAGEPFLGDSDARLKTLLPAAPEFDMAVNLFCFEIGAALPFVETHVMEHGLYMTEGQGVYRLDDCWHPVQAHDAIWMASYCPQWFCAIGKSPSAYLYYKDVHRDPLSRVE
jgi:(S)-ureidoglycine aminohydrolase